MARLDKDDLAQMNEDYFRSLDQERLVEVAKNLHQLAAELWEKQQLNSENSSQPPSSDNPYASKSRTEETTDNQSLQETQEQNKKKKELAGQAKAGQEKSNRKPGKQPGSEGKWRSQSLKAEVVIAHHPSDCAACNHPLVESTTKPYMGHYALELKRSEAGFRIECQLHHYYQETCGCGHITQAKPGEGYISEVEGRKRDLKLTEYVLVAPMLASFIASLGVRFRMSRPKIREFLWDWTKTELSVATIDRCIREAGIACVPVVEELVEQLQQADLLHLDELRQQRRRLTHWYEQGKLHWLWVALTTLDSSFSYWLSQKRRIISSGHRSFFGLVGNRWLSCLSFSS